MKKSVTIKAAWIGAVAIICAAIITVLFSPGKQEEHISQTGNTNVFSKDHVKGDKLVNIGPSDEDIKRIVEKTLQAQEERLKKKYPLGYFGFGIINNSLIVPKGLIPSDIEVDWSTGKILKETDTKIYLLLPSMIFKGIKFWDNRTSLKKQVGLAQKTGYRVNNIRMISEIIGIDKVNDVLIIGIGFVEVQS